MNLQASPPSRGPASAPGDRTRLARVALEAALTTPGVLRGEAGPRALRLTVDRGERLAGVSATAQRDGRYDVDLRLVADLVPLHPLADAVRARVRASAGRAGLTALVGAIDVEFADIGSPVGPG
jgi:hypothetical protein